MSTKLQTQVEAGSKASDVITTNNAVKRHFSSQRGFSAEAQRYPIQAKLKIGQPGDKYEQEADRVAEQVMRMPESQCPECEEEISRKAVSIQRLAQSTDHKIQSQCTECEEEIQRKPIEEEEEEEELLQAKEVSDRTPEVSQTIGTQINSIRGSGQPLSGSVRSFFEPRFGHDFSQVRVYTDAQAVESAHAVNAHAFTVGRDIIFGAGTFAPETSKGRFLLAHELSHTIQQKGHGIMMQRYPGFQDCDRNGGYRERVAIVHANNRAIEMLRNTHRILREAIWSQSPIAYPERAPRVHRPTLIDEQLAAHLWTHFRIRVVNGMLDQRQLDQVRIINRVVAQTLSGLVEEDFSYQCDYQSDLFVGECDPGVHAWTGVGSNLYDIHICWDFFTLFPRSKALKIIHEASHRWGGTDHEGIPDFDTMHTLGYEQLVSDLNPE